MVYPPRRPHRAHGSRRSRDHVADTRGCRQMAPVRESARTETTAPAMGTCWRIADRARRGSATSVGPTSVGPRSRAGPATALVATRTASAPRTRKRAHRGLAELPHGGSRRATMHSLDECRWTDSSRDLAHAPGGCWRLSARRFCRCLRSCDAIGAHSRSNNRSGQAHRNHAGRRAAG